MFLIVLILRADPPLPRVVCAVAFIFGLTAFLFGLRRPRVRPELAHAPLKPASSNSSTSPLPASPEPEIVTQQVIRLSLPSISARSTDMTQQEKVAAALVRAGNATPASRTSSSPTLPSDNSASTSTVVADPPPLPEKEFTSTSQSSEPASRGLARKLLLFGGPLVALISLYLFLRIR